MRKLSCLWRWARAASVASVAAGRKLIKRGLKMAENAVKQAELPKFENQEKPAENGRSASKSVQAGGLVWRFVLNQIQEIRRQTAIELGIMDSVGSRQG